MLAAAKPIVDLGLGDLGYEYINSTAAPSPILVVLEFAANAAQSTTAGL
jgi:hypothetical protein